MARIGYSRVSSLDQDLDGQVARLHAEGCTKDGSLMRLSWYGSFLSKRSNATKTMAESVIAILASKARYGGTVAAIVGSAHAAEMRNRLLNSSKSVVVFLPNSMTIRTNRYSSEEMRLKEEIKPSRQDSFGSILRGETVAPAQMKPQPTLLSPAVLTEYELIDHLDRITQMAFGSKGGGNGGIIPPTNTGTGSKEPDDRSSINLFLSKLKPQLLIGNGFAIEKDKIEVLRDKSGFASLLMPIHLVQQDKQMWVKTTRSDASLRNTANQAPEEKLLSAATDRPKAQQNDGVEKDELTPDVSIAFGEEKQKVENSTLHQS